MFMSGAVCYCEENVGERAVIPLCRSGAEGKEQREALGTARYLFPRYQTVTLQ